MEQFKSFRCGECGTPESVKLLPGKNRTYQVVYGFDTLIPDDFLIPTCEKCGETYSVPEIDEVLHPILRDIFQKKYPEYHGNFRGINFKLI